MQGRITLQFFMDRKIVQQGCGHGEEPHHAWCRLVQDGHDVQRALDIGLEGLCWPNTHGIGQCPGPQQISNIFKGARCARRSWWPGDRGSKAPMA
jgi:hypothetical protein